VSAASEPRRCSGAAVLVAHRATTHHPPQGDHAPFLLPILSSSLCF
jgi:hypothetical protein